MLRVTGFIYPKMGFKKQSVGNRNLLSFPGSEINPYRKKKSRKLSRKVAFYQVRKLKEV